MGLSEMPENFKPSHAINYSFRPRTNCVHFEKEKEWSMYFLSHSHLQCECLTLSENTEPLKMHNAKANSLMEI